MEHECGPHDDDAYDSVEEDEEGDHSFYGYENFDEDPAALVKKKTYGKEEHFWKHTNGVRQKCRQQNVIAGYPKQIPKW